MRLQAQRRVINTPAELSTPLQHDMVSLQSTLDCKTLVVVNANLRIKQFQPANLKPVRDAKERLTDGGRPSFPNM